MHFRNSCFGWSYGRATDCRTGKSKVVEVIPGVDRLYLVRSEKQHTKENKNNIYPAAFPEFLGFASGVVVS